MAIRTQPSLHLSRASPYPSSSSSMPKYNHSNNNHSSLSNNNHSSKYNRPTRKYNHSSSMASLTSPSTDVYDLPNMSSSILDPPIKFCEYCAKMKKSPAVVKSHNIYDHKCGICSGMGHPPWAHCNICKSFAHQTADHKSECFECGGSHETREHFCYYCWQKGHGESSHVCLYCPGPHNTGAHICRICFVVGHSDHPFDENRFRRQVDDVLIGDEFTVVLVDLIMSYSNGDVHDICDWCGVKYCHEQRHIHDASLRCLFCRKCGHGSFSCPNSYGLSGLASLIPSEYKVEHSSGTQGFTRDLDLRSKPLSGSSVPSNFQPGSSSFESGTHLITSPRILGTAMIPSMWQSTSEDSRNSGSGTTTSSFEYSADSVPDYSSVFNGVSEYGS